MSRPAGEAPDSNIAICTYGDSEPGFEKTSQEEGTHWKANVPQRSDWGQGCIFSGSDRAVILSFLEHQVSQ